MARLLKVEGRIALDQFWPLGSSDADTTKIKLSVEPGAFFFDFDGKGFQRTDVFEGAEARGTGRKQVISKERKITVRLQGVDAPELHYKAAALKKSADITAEERKKFNTINREGRRQFLAESATVALAKFLAGLGDGEIPCQYYSFVDAPGDAIDTYGRFVGNIMVGPDFATDLNVWLCEQGWVYPTFYSSMAVDEIQIFLDATAKGKKRGRVWKHYSRDLSRLDLDLVYRGIGADIDAAADRGPIVMPKVFRRLLAFTVEKKAKIRSGAFATYLTSRRDECFTLEDFIEQGPHAAEIRTLDEFVAGTRFKPEPQALVFREKPSALFNAKGKKITSF